MDLLAALRAHRVVGIIRGTGGAAAEATCVVGARAERLLVRDGVFDRVPFLDVANAMLAPLILAWVYSRTTPLTQR